MLTQDIIDNLNMNNFFRDLPEEYDTDGIYFVNGNGNKSLNHPSI